MSYFKSFFHLLRGSPANLVKPLQVGRQKRQLLRTFFSKNTKNEIIPGTLNGLNWGPICGSGMPSRGSSCSPEELPSIIMSSLVSPSSL